MTTVPAFGSLDWHLLPHRDPRRMLARLVHDAWRWRTLRKSAHVADLLDEFCEWADRKRHREASWAVAGAVKERAERGWRPGLSYAAIELRRGEVGRACLEFRSRHGGEYTGGPVDWRTGKGCADSAPPEGAA